ncbi:DNA-binding NtrC family response regulator [Rhodoligotrophos appendicifer]|uniref:response regulator n=1 Tax=Rhodoligotrophos appendicifer TaxID=987056 RepID=UPI0011846FB8|nr:response regulator [Rhodoligotrophos appendicifer]
MSPKICVLIVEDEILIRMDLADFLTEEGFEVLEAANADEAIAILEAKDEIQVMFTDVDMPGSMDGLKLSLAVRDRWPPIRIVVTSGHRAVALSDLPENSLFYAKPYDHAAIAASLRGILSD